MNDNRDTHRRSCSAPKRHWKRSYRRSYDSSSSSDTTMHISRRNRRSRCQDARNHNRSRSPRYIAVRDDHRRHRARSSSDSDSHDATRRAVTVRMTQRANHHGKGQQDRRICGVGDATTFQKCQRIAPNTSALQSIMLGTARSRDRMDERERARAKKKLEHLNATATTL